MTQLSKSLLCNDCEEIFDCMYLSSKGRCPRCGSQAVVPLSKFVPSMSRIQHGAVRKGAAGNTSCPA